SPEACPDAVVLGRLADEAHTILASLGLSTDELDRALDSLRNAGATGAKLSGAGGGGAFFGVFVKRAEATAALESIGDALDRAGTPAVHLAVTRIGSTT
ncbi:MAG: hypothetical protein ACOC2N_03730, partial [Spirochaetota bacterium]